MSRRERQRWSCDFETTTQEDDCRVWAWAVSCVDDPDRVLFGNSIEGFMAWCATLPDGSCLWFHNLKFDGEFIFNHILAQGWEWVEDVAESTPLTFSTLISDKGQHYQYHLRFSATVAIEVRDSLKVIPLPVAKIPKAFGLPDAKLTLDYQGVREVGHELTQEERDYVREDVVIVAKALRILLDDGMTRLTSGANSMAAYKREMGGEKGFRRKFPEPDYDDMVRRSYRGGFTYVNPLHQGRELGEGMSFDVNSLYPFRDADEAPTIRRSQVLLWEVPERRALPPVRAGRCHRLQVKGWANTLYAGEGYDVLR